MWGDMATAYLSICICFQRSSQDTFAALFSLVSGQVGRVSEQAPSLLSRRRESLAASHVAELLAPKT